MADYWIPFAGLSPSLSPDMFEVVVVVVVIVVVVVVGGGVVVLPSRLLSRRLSRIFIGSFALNLL